VPKPPVTTKSKVTLERLLFVTLKDLPFATQKHPEALKVVANG
jgi:hypothetical protein